MFRRGDLVSAAEGALIASVPRQTISRWIREAEIDVTASRLQHLARCQAKAQRYAAGLPPLLKPTKAQMRRTLEDAMRRFNAANAKPNEGSQSA